MTLVATQTEEPAVHPMRSLAGATAVTQARGPVTGVLPLVDTAPIVLGEHEGIVADHRLQLPSRWPKGTAIPAVVSGDDDALRDGLVTEAVDVASLLL